MVLVRHIHAYMLTRPQPAWAGSGGTVVIRIGGQAFDTGETPPENGRYKFIGLRDVEISFDPASTPIEIGILGKDAWCPREVILTAIYQLPTLSPAFLGAMAIGRPVLDDAVGGNVILSQDPSDGGDTDALARWSLPSFQPATRTGYIREFLLRLLTDRAFATTQGPLDFTLYGSASGVPFVIYQTVLPRVGAEVPGASGGYMYRFRLETNAVGVPFSAIEGATITNRSDDAWGAVDAELYGWGFGASGEVRGGLLTSHSRLTVVSQDLSDDFVDLDQLQWQQGWSSPRPALLLRMMSAPRCVGSIPEDL